MANVKRIVCLANSRKLSGRCIAGREWSREVAAGGWIRPVSARENREVSEYERQYEDGSDPKVLDIVDVPVLEPLPEGWQTENWLLDPELYWKKAGTCSPFDLSRLTDPVAPLWIDGDSTWRGSNDRMPGEPADRPSGSLRLIRVPRMDVAVLRPGEAFGNDKRRVQGRFLHAGTSYALWITDPRYEREYLAKLDGTYELGECYLTIGIGEPYRGFCYKLVAAIIEPNGT